MHAQKLVHRDVKPANVLLDRSGHAYLCDFGLTKQASSVSGLTGTGPLVGTLEYLAPEQIRREQVDAGPRRIALHRLPGRPLRGAPDTEVADGEERDLRLRRRCSGERKDAGEHADCG